MPHPYQCLLYCSRPGQAEAGILVASSGPYIHTFNVHNGTYLSTWPSGQELGKSSKGDAMAELGSGLSGGTQTHQDNSQRPRKRQKLSPPRDDSGSSAEIVVNGGDAEDQNARLKQAIVPPVIKLAGTSDGHHVVAVTGEDKCIRVFELPEDGCLIQLSERVMPKRPCAVALTPDESTLLCADKFGDIYSLPLMGQTHGSVLCPADDKQALENGSNGPPPKEFVPSASSLTVHTKGNREALRQQQKIKNPKAEKKTLNFDHRLLLGHVSLLTDVTCVSISYSNRMRNYILSSDRDEHIRVSRGIPQAHIIEGYCLGHTEFVSKICIPPAYPHLLISGGGDESLLLWDWHSGKIRQKLELRRLVDDLKRQQGLEPTSAKPITRDQEADASGEVEDKFAISNIHVRHWSKSKASKLETGIIVTCEGIPALFHFRIGIEVEEMIYVGTYGPLNGNVIDVVAFQDQEAVVYSMDTVHKAFSTTTVANDEEQKERSSIGVMKITQNAMSEMCLQQNQHLQLVTAMEQCIQRQSFIHENSTAKGKSMRDLLYGLKSLRKRGGDEQNNRGDD